MSTLAAAPLAACIDVSVVHGGRTPQVKALNRIALEVRTRETLALWGPSGSGKTTLLHVLGGLLEPSSGDVLWHGEPLFSLDATARGKLRSRGIAYVFQGANLLPYFSAQENVAFAQYAARARPRADERTPEASELLALVGLADKLDALPSELSGGEAQRVAIARALAQQPELLVCDEPTGHLDVDTGERVLMLIDALQAESGFALITATHDADVAARHGRIVELSDGAIVSETQT